MRTKLSLKKSARARGAKTPTTSPTISEKSPRLYTGSKKLDTYTTKNVEVGCYPFLYNYFMNNRLIYRRLTRGGRPEDAFKTRLGPKAVRLTKANYQTLKKGQKIYMDRGSVFFRGPFIFQRYSRGPLLNLSARDVGYDNTYNFTMHPTDLEDSDFVLYAVTQKTGQTKKGRTRTIRRKTVRRRRKYKTRKRKRKPSKRRRRRR